MLTSIQNSIVVLFPFPAISDYDAATLSATLRAIDFYRLFQEIST